MKKTDPVVGAGGGEETAREKTEAEPVEPFVPAGGALVRVTTGESGVVAGAEVRVIHEDGMSFRSITDASGRAVLDAGSAGVATVWLSSPERGRKRYDGVSLSEEETSLELPAGERLKVSFVDLSGEEVPVDTVQRLYGEHGTDTTVGIRSGGDVLRDQHSDTDPSGLRAERQLEGDREPDLRRRGRVSRRPSGARALAALP